MGKPERRSCVLITGATTGIGYELAKLYAKDGYNLLLIARNIDNLEKVRDEVSLYNINVDILAVDLAVDNSCEKVFNFVDEKNLTVDILINNAGVGSFGYLSETEMKKELSLIDLNIKSLTEMTKHFLPRMIESDYGSIINVSSTAAFCAGPKMAVYYASKAYVLSFTEALYEEVKGTNIKVSCLCPGAVDTGFQNKAGIKKSKSAKNNLMSVSKVANLAYRDFNKGKLIIIPGAKNKVLVIMNKFMPRFISRRVILLMNKG